MFSLHKKILFALLVVLCIFSSMPLYAVENTVNKVAAIVNGEMISLHDISRQAAAELRKLNISPNDSRAEEVLHQVLEAKINDVLIKQEAVRYKISISTSELDNEIKNIASNNHLNVKQLEARLKKDGLSLESLKDNLRNGMLRQRIMTFMVARKVIVTNDEVEAYYTKNKSQFVKGKNVDFSVLIFKNAKDAQSVYNKIQSGSLSFEDAAKKYSKDYSGKNGGRVGARPWESLPPSFQQLMSSIPPGKTSPLIAIEGSPSIIKLNEITQGSEQTLEEARPQIEQVLREPKLQERFKDYIQQLRSKAVIDIRL